MDRYERIIALHRSLQAARRPVTVAHLQDEVGDIVSMPHPYSGITAKMFVPRLVRECTPGGSAIDTIDGWIL